VEHDVDVVVVGAGLAGLSAAHVLEAAGLGTQVVEARDRVGGRTLNHALGSGQPIEIGGQWVGPTQDRVLAMAQRLGVETYPTYDKGWHQLSFGGRVRRFRNTLPPRLPPAVLADYVGALLRLGRMARSVPLEAPWQAPRAGEWDGTTLEAWIQTATRTDGARSLLRLTVTSVLAAEPGEASLLHALFYARSGGFSRLLSSAQRWRLVGGSQELSVRQATALKRPVRLSAPVASLIQEPDGVVVTGSGWELRADRVVVTAPPAVTAKIDVRPELPDDRARLARCTEMGSVIKFLAVYDTPFWRSDGLSGQASADTGLVRVVFDNTPPTGGPGVLVAFAEADDARALRTRSAEERRRETLDTLVRFFGPRAAEPVEFVERDWSADEWSGGCYGALFPPGAWTSAGPALRRPVGRIHWAGSESSTVWAGYMDGAVRSGERVATEILSARQARPVPR
jgi:monoamine oxidase